MTAARVASALTTYADPARMTRWLRLAVPGHRIIYATGASLEGGRHPAARLAREWQEAGLASLVQQRRADGLIDFCAVKARPACPVIPRGRGSDPAGSAGGAGADASASPVDRKGRGPDPLADAAFAASDEGRMYQHLRGIAARGLACPSHAGLAARLGLEGRRGTRSADAPRQQARYLFEKLCSTGLIRLIEPARFGSRVIEITETGDRTASQPDGNFKGEPA